MILVKIRDITAASLKDVDDRELLSLHRRTHQLAGALFSEPRERTEDGDEGRLTWEDLVNAHAIIVEEMEARGMRHNAHDRLDEESERLQQKSQGQGIEAKLACLPDEVMVIPNFVCVVGSVAAGDEDPEDIDVLFRADRDKSGKYFLTRRITCGCPCGRSWTPTRQEYCISSMPHKGVMPISFLVTHWCSGERSLYARLRSISPGGTTRRPTGTGGADGWRT